MDLHFVFCITIRKMYSQVDLYYYQSTGTISNFIGANVEIELVMMSAVQLVKWHMCQLIMLMVAAVAPLSPTVIAICR